MPGNPSPVLLGRAAKYVEAGFSLIPVRADGSKAAAVTWKPYQERKPTAEELRQWFGNGTVRGLAFVHGAVSGNSEVLDFDAPGAYEEFVTLCADHQLADLIERIPLIETPSGGRHLLYRCESPVEGNQKLARDASGEVKIETRGEGGYTLAPGSPAACHPDGREYTFLRKRPVPTLTAAERHALLAMARVLNDHIEPEQIHRPNSWARARGPISDGIRPGEDFNERGDSLALLERHGWRVIGQRGDTTLLRRPGKAQGHSATYGIGGSRLFYCFTSSAPPFETEKAYPPFSVYGLLECGGDFTEAARRLAADGYGDQTPRSLREKTAPAPNRPEVPETEETDATLSDFEFTDGGNADRFILLHGNDVRFVPGLGWRAWNGTRWEAGEAVASRLARETVRAIYAHAGKIAEEAREAEDTIARKMLAVRAEDLLKHARRSDSASKISAIVALARTDPRIEAKVSDFEIKPWCVGFPNGMWDRGEFREHRREDHTETLTAVRYDAGADRTDWEALLNRLTDSDEDLARMLQDVAGYAFSGASSLRLLPWLYGPKGSGKSTFAEILQTALGDTAKPLDWSLLSGDREAERLGATIRGMRAVFLPEAGRKRLDADVLKMLSGGDRLPGRDLFQTSTYTVTPTWALIAVSNDPPNMTAYDDALHDRLRALPFTRPLANGGPLRFTKGEKIESYRRRTDTNLIAGFVAWAVEGLARVYKAQGIHQAKAATQHTRQFWSDADPLTPFWDQIEDGERRLSEGVKAGELRAMYISWCEQEGIRKPLAAGTPWGDACRAHGLTKTPITSGPDKGREIWRVSQGGLFASGEEDGRRVDGSRAFSTLRVQENESEERFQKEGLPVYPSTGNIASDISDAVSHTSSQIQNPGEDWGFTSETSDGGSPLIDTTDLEDPFADAADEEERRA